MRRVLIGLAAAALISAGGLAGEGAQDAPWWKEQKIRFMWGCWGFANHDTSIRPAHIRLVPREVFRNAALSGATVFADTWYHKPAHARLAKEFGMRYFAGTHVDITLWDPKGRAWVKESGESEMVGKSTVKCRLDETVYERWLVGRNLAGVREGIIDGIHVDWEARGYTMKTPCYCDDCFSKFPAFKETGEDLPDKDKRFGWIEDRGLVEAWEANFSKRRVEMFTRIREKLHALNSRLLFSSYGTALSDFTRAMNTPETPFIFLDSRHYYNDDRQPWWESYSQRLRQEGYLYICGGWTNALFGSQPSQVSAARWIYETSINEDGCWLWFEHELTDDMFGAYAAADRQLKAVEARVGEFLFYGKRDPGFVTATEWTGRPDLAQAVIHQTYHLGSAHLAHVNNVNTEWPLRTRIRFPRLPAGQRWTVRDPMGDLYYTHDGKSDVWTSADLLAGVVVAMEPRSDLFLLVSPADEKLKADPSRLMHSRDFDALPGHAAASASAAADTAKPKEDLPSYGWRFRMDKEDVGVKREWFLPESSLEGWIPIEIEDFWGNKGGTGPGWYRRDVDVPDLPEDKRIYLHFGAVDEELMLWIDGQHAGDYDRGPGGWDKPFAVDVTGKLTAGKHHLAMRIYNSAMAGGVWKPVSILAGGADGVVAETCLYGEKLESLLTSARKLSIPFVASGPSGRMVYTATEVMGFEGSGGARTIIGNAIRTVDGDGTNQLRVRQLRGHLWSPRFSPDGRRIAFVHDTGGRGQIFLMNADGSDALNVSNNDFCERSPVWSPDGKRITFVSDRSGDWDIFTMNADGSGQLHLAGNAGLDRAPVWSPDGTRLAWESHVSGMPNIWVCDANGQNSRPLIAPDRPLVVQEGKVGQDKVFTFVETDQAFPDNTFYLVDPVWSPDGSRIAAVGLGEYSGSTVVVLDADGSRMLHIIRWIAGPADLTWSPDGTRLSGTLRTAPQETERSGVFIVKADGTDKYRWLVDVTPQGPRLGGASSRGLVTWYSHGSARPRRVVKSFGSLAWSPDGETLAFSSDVEPSGAFYVYTVTPDGGRPKRLDATKSAWPNQIMWRPIPSPADGQ